MARARNIKPGFFTNDLLAELDMAGRLLFVGLWTIADREGRLLDRPKKIKMDLFPADDVDVDAHLTALADRGFLTRYAVDGVRCIEIVNWHKHQKPHSREADSTIPGHAEAPPEESQSTTKAVTEHDLGDDESQPRPPVFVDQVGSCLPDSGLLIADSGLGIADTAPGAASAASPSNAPARPVKPTPKNDNEDGRIYALVDAFAFATKRRSDQLQGRKRSEAKAAFRPLVNDITSEDVIGCAAWMRTDSFYREPGRLTAEKLAEVIPQWIAADRPTSIQPTRSKTNGAATVADANAAAFAQVKAMVREKPPPPDPSNVVDVTDYRVKGTGS